ncbi:MAG: SPFH domain-containing protein [Atopobiaceae bacterium]|nr:SPFH domain-containing protein [Atopobiaceae bacterium]
MSVEKRGHSASGWSMLVVVIVAFAASVALFVMGQVGRTNLALEVTACAVFVLACFAANGFFTVQPGQARVCVLFGKYAGTVREEGLRWANPLYARNVRASTSFARKGEAAKVSVRARTLNGEHLKVNDKMGNPIEIANVVVWHVEDTAKACFDVDDYESFVDMQAETALRHVASVYAYDHMEDDSESSKTITLRSNIEEISEALKRELGQRFAPAGVAVDDARLTHLAYAPEIAQAMLRRQQAEAIIAARKKIVEGAVSMVDMAVKQLSSSGTIDLDDERKASMASNLMVVLCGESEAQPVVNAGTLYQG